MADLLDQARKLVGIEVTVSSLIAVAHDGTGKALDKHVVPYDTSQASVPQIADFIGDLKGKFGGFETAGLAVPGLIRRDSQDVAFSAQMPEHSEVELAGELEKSAGVRIHIENDANAAAYGEYKLGAGRGAANLFYVTLGKGVGGAFILKDRIWHGVSGFAGEFGYVAINSDGMRLEDVASAANIVRRTRTRFNRDSTSSLHRLAEEQITLERIVDAAEKGDDFAGLMLERTGNYVGTAVATVINLLNIERIVVGGEIMQAGDRVLNAIRSRARELSFGPSFANVDIVAGELHDNAAAIGVGLIANQQ
ncbi:MAG TPA: ROK family protein [Pyrinomonadaceae bacterium]|nr:ROK family protein [Pyrinomonadaceae bacterium]